MTTILRMPTPPIESDERPVRPLNAGPPARAVITEQLRLTGLLLRGGGAFFGVLLLGALVLPLLTLSGSAARGGSPGLNVSNLTFTPEMSGPMVLLALIVPLIVWRDEEPARRDYHWLMPVPRRTHTLMRAFAGWCWTMVATLAYVIVIGILPVIVQGLTTVAQPYHPGFSVWEWLVPFGAATVAYALASVAAVTAQRPLVWVFGSLAIYAGIVLIMLTQGMRRAATALLHAWDGSFGLRSVLYGVTASADGLTSPDVLHWALATTLWGGGAIALLWFASSLRWRR